MQRIYRKSILVLVLGVAGAGCGADDVVVSPRVLVSEQDVAPGRDCRTGGKRIAFGADEDGDDVLDSSEVDETIVLCNGEDGAAGDPGPSGSPGVEGPPGAQGGAGPAGEDGHASLVALSELPPGESCVNGGTLIEVGLDDGEGEGIADDGVLQPDEVDDSSTVCGGGLACSAPAFDTDLGTGKVDHLTDVEYVADNVTLECNDSGTTADLVFRWTPSATGCHQFNPLISGEGGHPFLAVLDACTGEALKCNHAGTTLNVEQGKTYLIALEPEEVGDRLGFLSITKVLDSSCP